jgi:hypothetical protein
MLSLGAVVLDDPKTTFYVELKPMNDKFVPAAMKVVGKSLKDFAKNGRDPKEAMTGSRTVRHGHDTELHFARPSDGCICTSLSKYLRNL